MKLPELKQSGDAPEWMNDEGYRTLQGGYMLPGETPRNMYRRVARAAASYYEDKSEWEERFFNVMWKNWLCLASPVLSNMGTNRGLPISCLTGDTWLNTRTGGVQVKDVIEGVELLTHEGRYKRVTDVKSRQSTNDLFVLTVGTRTTPLRITGNHPVLTNLGWVRVDELDPKIHFIATNDQIEVVEKPHTLNMRHFTNYAFQEVGGRLVKTSTNKLKRKRPENGLVNYVAKVRADVEVSTDLSWAFGLWFAEGSRTIDPKKVPNGVRITMGQDEEPALSRWLSVMSGEFGVNGKVSFSEATRVNFAHGRTTRWASANVNSKVVGQFFQSVFGANCKDKSIPQWLMDLPCTHLEAFLEGLLEGDGHYRPNGSWSITLANPRLLLGVYNICLKLGIQVSLQMQAKPSSIGTTKYVYALRSIKSDSVKLGRFNVDSGIVFGKLRYCPIFRLDRLPYNDEVFDITVEEDHSFSAAGVVVHNCNTIHVGDSIESIFHKNFELAMLSKHGAGVGIYLGDVRGRGSPIKGNGVSEGIVPWSKVYDTTTVSVSQGSTRRGASSLYLPIEHIDISEFLQIRRPTGDVNRRCLNTNHGVCINNDWMKSMLAGDSKKRETWIEILRTRSETGEPYLMFTDNANAANPACYTDKGLSVKSSNICCLSGDTLVLTRSGPEPISSLVGRTVEIFDGRSWVETDTFSQRGEDTLLRITLANGMTVDSNENHRWFVASTYGDIDTNRYSEVTTVNLKEGQWLESHSEKSTGWRRIVSIERLEGGTVPVYCPTLPTTGKFALANGLMTGNTEIMLHTDPEHSFVCCLSSLNLLRWEEWRNTDLVNVAVRLLDAVMEEYIRKTERIQGFSASRASAIKGRAIGIGVLGWHSLLQSSKIAFDSFEAMQLNAQVFSTIRRKAEEETKVMAKELGEPEWCKGHNRRNTHLMAIAPTVSNSSISGGFSAGIEPLTANVFTVKSAKGTFIRKNTILESLLESMGKNTPDIWRSINEMSGSVQHLPFLTDHEKEVYLTAREINQHAIIKQAAQRQRWVDQGQSVNLFFGSNSDPRYVHEVHVAAWEMGLKSLYYFRTEGVLRGDLASRTKEECKACEG